VYKKYGLSTKHLSSHFLLITYLDNTVLHISLATNFVGSVPHYLLDSI